MCASGTTPRALSAPTGGFHPTTPCSNAHPTTENEVSVPSAAAHNPAATATADPLDDPLTSQPRSYSCTTCPPREEYPFGMSRDT